MLFRQHHLACLSQFSYLIGDETTGRAVVVDPQRDVSVYVDEAASLGVRIERVIETHFHADFLSGHLELAAMTGAAVSYGSGARPDFPIEPLEHGRRLGLGEVVLEVRHTPGHTPESVCLVVWERDGDTEPWAVLTGDTLFVGDVGRPDLLAAEGWTAGELAALLRRSLHEQLLTLPDATRVFPAHGAGSACGKALSEATSSTIGVERATNRALQPMGEDAFVASLTEGQPVRPRYFESAAAANRHAHPLLDDHEPPPRLDVDAVPAGAVVLDTRSPDAFAAGHLSGSINVGLDGRFAEHAGNAVPAGAAIVVVADEGREVEARVRLARVGFDRVVGHLPPLGTVCTARVTWADVGPDVQLVDVRNPGEVAAGPVPGARNVPLPTLLDRVGELDPARPTVVFCASGYRSSVAASVLRAAGFPDVADVVGGYASVSRLGASASDRPT
jgi:hydroxyacylglutathione hydrolase